MNVRTAPRMDKAAFLDWLHGQDRRFELVDGAPSMQANVTRGHMRIVMNLFRLLTTALDVDLYNVATGDFAVETGPATVRFADVMVERAGGSASGLSTQDALLLVEVLPPATAHVDLGAKLREYQGLPSLGSYLVCAQDSTTVSVWTRTPDTGWPDQPVVVSGMERDVGIPLLGLTLPLREIYRGLA
jgi:Uma2 family endonuclease